MLKIRDRDPLKPRPHERFFACDGDAILSRRQRAVKITSVDTLAKVTRQACRLSRKIQLVEFFAIFFCELFGVGLPVRGWLHMPIFAARWRRESFQKTLYQHRKEKILRVAVATDGANKRLLLLLWLQGTTLTVSVVLRRDNRARRTHERVQRQQTEHESARRNRLRAHCKGWFKPHSNGA